MSWTPAACKRASPRRRITACATTGVDGQIGLEQSPTDYVDELVTVFRGVRRALKSDGTLWLNLGDTYAGGRGGPQGATGQMNDRTVAKQRCRHRSADRIVDGVKPKDMLGIPWTVALALRADGWFLRSDIIWHKPNPMPGSQRDRPTSAHEYVFLFAKSSDYFYNADAIAEQAMGRGRRTGSGNGFVRPERFGNGAGDATPWLQTDTRTARDVWTIASRPFRGAHFATMPPDLAERCIAAGSRFGDTILDPFGGAGTTGLAAERLGRRSVLCELNPEYVEIARLRIDEASVAAVEELCA